MCQCFTPKRTFRTVCCCFPLALFALLGGICFVAWGAQEIYQFVTTSDASQWGVIINIIIAALRILMGLMGICAVLFKWAAGAQMLVAAYKILLASGVVTFIMMWISWIIEWTKEEKADPPFPTHDDTVLMITFTVLYVIFFIVSWWVMSCFSSLGAVLRAGGNGWERKNYLDIQAEKREANKSHKREEQRELV